VPQRGITPQTTPNMPKAARLRFSLSRRDRCMAMASSDCFAGRKDGASTKSMWRKSVVFVFFDFGKRRFLRDKRRREV
jgi:hypothetical protein